MRGLHIPTSGLPQFCTADLEDVKSFIFGSSIPVLSTFDGVCNYYRYSLHDSHYHPINQVATVIKRIYTQNYTVNNVIRGDIVVYASSDGFPNILDCSVPQYFIEEVLAYYVSKQFIY